MKYSAALLLALFGLTAASVLQQQEGNTWYNNRNTNNGNNNKNNIHHADQKFLEKQQTVLELLSNLEHNNPHTHLVQLGNSFNPHQNLDKFYNQFAVKNFLKNFVNNQFLPQNEVFSPTSQEHQNQAAQLFHFLYSAQDWTTMKQAAAWARDRINPQQFAYSFTAAVLNHPSTKGVVVPAMYEVVPHAFVPAPAMQKIYKAKIQGYGQATVNANYANQNKNNVNYNNNNSNNNNNNNQENDNQNNGNNNNNNYGTHNPTNVFADNDGSQNNNAGVTENPENRISYFTEDVGINAFHGGFHVQNPSFFGTNNNNNYYDNLMKTLLKNTHQKNNNNRHNNNNDNENENLNINSNENNNNNNNNENVDEEVMINLVNNNKYNTYNREAIKRGEAFYYAHQQLYARYVLERLSNNLPIPHPINFNDEIKDGYNANLQYSNGQTIPARPPQTQFQQQLMENNNNNNNALIPNNNQAQNPQVYEQRLQEVADSGYVLNEDGSKSQLNKNNAVGVLANLVAAPADSPNPSYYGDYFTTAKNAIGNIVDPNNQNGVAPGPVANLATAARDPAYYQLLAKINQIFNNLQNNLGPYTQNQLNFPGVKIQSFDVSRLITYFDTFTVNVNNEVNANTNKNENNNNNGNYNVKFQRLTNKPFNYKLTVHSDKNTDAVVRVFIGPKYDSNGQKFTLPQASQYFVQLDQFTVQLNNGQNVIERNSQESPNYVQDAPSFQQLWNRVQQAKQGQQPFVVNQAESRHCGFPQRVQLPKGKKSGQQFVFYAIVTEANNNNENLNNNNEDTMILNNNNNNNNNGNIMNLNNNNNENIMNLNNNNNENIMNLNNNNENIMNLNNNNNGIRKFESFYCGGNNYIQTQDNKSIAFPFDRPVVDALYTTPNMYFKTVTIYHKTQNNNNNNNNNNESNEN